MRPARGTPLGEDYAQKDAGSRVHGELIALNADSIYVLTQNGLAALPLAGVQSLKVTGYNPRTGDLRLWAFAGTLGTLSHGWYLIISARSG